MSSPLSEQQKNWINGFIANKFRIGRTKEQIMCFLVLAIGELWSKGSETGDNAMHMHEYAYERLFSESE